MASGRQLRSSRRRILDRFAGAKANLPIAVSHDQALTQWSVRNSREIGAVGIRGNDRNRESWSLLEVSYKFGGARREVERQGFAMFLHTLIPSKLG